jgi:ABC-type sugar transport systems, permease components
MNSRNKLKKWTPLFFILPALTYLVIFIAYPIVYNIILSFQDVNVMTIREPARPFIGLTNYQIILKDSVFKISLINTLYYTIISIIFQFVIGFALAVFFNLKFTTAKFVRGLVMVAWLLPVTITALTYKFMFSTDGGIINSILMGLGIIQKPIEWLLSNKEAMRSIIITNIWIGIPFNMLLLTTGLSTIPNEVYEASTIDGANKMQQFISVTVPLMKPAIMSVLVLGVIYTFKVFDLVFVMTNGGPVNATEMLSTLSYRYSFSEYSFSLGSTVANILFLMLFCVGLVYLKFIKNDEVM